ncbi:MAG: hypothetical protein HC812_20270, partial [Leptolyngbya sp. RL_3_1]|nr:hypothetical protein [Leptolyngbya sp. RL_3_1]
MTVVRWSRYLVCVLLALVLTAGCDRLLTQHNTTPAIARAPVVNADLLNQDLVPLAQPGPWPHITELIGYGDRSGLPTASPSRITTPLTFTATIPPRARAAMSATCLA